MSKGRSNEVAKPKIKGLDLWEGVPPALPPPHAVYVGKSHSYWHLRERERDERERRGW